MAKKNRNRNRNNGQPDVDQNDQDTGVDEEGTEDETGEEGTEVTQESEANTQPVEVQPVAESEQPQAAPAPAEEPAATEDPRAHIQRGRDAYGLPGEWTDSQVEEWLNHGRHDNAKTSRGNFVFDPTRTERDATTWRQGEILDYHEGALDASNVLSGTEKVVIDRLLSRQNVKGSEDWTFEEKSRFLKEGVAPTPKAPEVPVAPVTTITPPQGLPVSNFETIKAELENYYEAVKPGKAESENSGQTAQLQLDATFQYALNLGGEQFAAAFDVIRDFFAAHKDLFDATHAFRYTHTLEGTGVSKNAHDRILTYFLTLIGPNPRAVLQFDTQFAFNDLDEEKRQLLVAYFESRGEEA